MLRSLTLLLVFTSPVSAQEDVTQPDLLSVVAEQVEVDLATLLAPVHRPEGAESPEQALEYFSQAAVDGDIHAALLLIDPEVRPLISLEVSIDHVRTMLKVMEVQMKSEFPDEVGVARLRIQPGFCGTRHHAGEGDSSP